MKKFVIVTCFLFLIQASGVLIAQSKIRLVNIHPQSKLIKTSEMENIITAEVLDYLNLLFVPEKTSVEVSDAAGKVYFQSAASPDLAFMVSGTLGKHWVRVYDAKKKSRTEISFLVKATSTIDDGGKFNAMFDLFHRSMLEYRGKGYAIYPFNGKDFKLYVSWVLDNAETHKGMRYFEPYGRDMIDLFGSQQQKDGMIWSNIFHDDGKTGYLETAYQPMGYAERHGKIIFSRQPNENHVEYLFVNLFYQAWQESGDLEWMKKNLDVAARALDYSITDPVRWSARFKLLKRPMCIDSWDFQVDDEYTPQDNLVPTMLIDRQKTKFGVFFGDNTGYALACEQLSEMMRIAGNVAGAEKYKKRALEIRTNLNALAWNGKFFTHFIDEDPSVKRNLGVDMNLQIAQANMYSINRNIATDQVKAIIETYLDLKKNLPAGSPGEWYNIYPPFEKGFGMHNEKWQYMNGGVSGHAAFELVRGAFEAGYEEYAIDAMTRLYQLGKEHGNKLYFNYTGAIMPPPSKTVYSPLNIAIQANMDLTDKASNGVFSWMNEKEGNDMRNLPVGEWKVGDIQFKIIDPASNKRKSVLAVSSLAGFPQKIEVPVNQFAKSIYFLHTSSKTNKENICGSITYLYEDGSKHNQYVIYGKHLSGWWFPDLKNNYAGLAWEGENLKSKRVGLSWCSIDNPNPDKKIAKIVIQGSVDNNIYVVCGISLSDQPHYVVPKIPSYGGPDNWTGGLAMASIMEGLAGIKDKTYQYKSVRVAPRWAYAGTDTIKVVARYVASDAYTAYYYFHSPAKRQIKLVFSASGENLDVHLLMPKNSSAKSVQINNSMHPFQLSKIENSDYVDFSIVPINHKEAIINY